MNNNRRVKIRFVAPLKPLHQIPLTTCLTLILSGGFGIPQITEAQTQPMERRGAHQLRQEIRALSAKPHASGMPRPTAVVTVTNCLDDGSAGTLRNTIAAAAEGDTIDLSALTCSTITLASGAVPVDFDNLTIHGPGASALTINGAAADRVLVHPGGGTLTLQGINFTNGRIVRSGNHVTGGGCIASGGDVVLDHASVNNCFAAAEGAYGGAIIANSLTMQTSTISGNTALGTHPAYSTATFGGGAYVYTVTLIDSTVSGNRAQRDPANGSQSSYDIGGGIFADFGGTISGSTIERNYSTTNGGGIASFSGLTVLNSTISGNTAANNSGGGIHVRMLTDFNLRNCTVTANHAGNGGGVWLWTPLAMTNIQSSIIAGNTAAAGNASDLSAASAISVSGGNNFIDSSNTLIALPSDTLHGDPRLSPLADNGGPTRTHALRFNSPALNAGSNPTGVSTDQRGLGYPRVFGIGADIGAFEIQAIAPAEPLPAGGRGLLGLLTILLVWIGWRKIHAAQKSFPLT